MSLTVPRQTQNTRPTPTAFTGLPVAVHYLNVPAKDRGCTHPGCDVSGYHCEAHHVEDWAKTHRTDINPLTLACGPHHKLIDDGWTTRQRANGNIEWIPPPRHDHGQPRTNTYHHPEKLFTDGDDEDDR